MSQDRHWNRVAPEARPRGFSFRWDLDVGVNAYALPLVVDTSHVVVAVAGPGRGGIARALDLADGSTRWEATLEQSPSATPARSGRLAILAARRGEVVALDVEDGRMAWRTALEGPIQGGPLVVDDGVVVPIGQMRPWQPGPVGAVVALASDGAMRWRAELDGPVAVTPTRVSDTQVAVATTNGTVHVVELDTGDVTDVVVPHESEHDSPDAPIVGTAVVAPILRLDGLSFVLATSGTLFAFEDDGTERWAWEPVSANWSALASDGASVLLPGPDGRLVAFDPQTGERRWHVERLGRREPTRWGTPLVVGDAVLAPTSEGELVAVHARDGRELASTMTERDAIGVHLATDARGDILVAALGQARRVACWDLLS